MRFYLKPVLALLFVALTVAACDLKKQLDELANLARCNYQLANLSDIKVSGIAVSGKTSISDFSIPDGIQLLSDYTSGNLPLTMNVNLNVQNPQKDSAAFSQVDYIMALDGTQVTQGSVAKRFSVGPSATSVLSVGVGFNLKTVFASSTLQSLENLVVGLADPTQSSMPTRIGMRIRPSFIVAGQTVKFPNYFTVNTTLKGDSL